MIDIMEKAAREAGTILLHYYKKGVNPKNKTSHHDLVTEADPEAQEKIISSLKASLHDKGLNESDFGFMAEEDLVNFKGTHMFVIDPLDGTNNFASGLPIFCVSIAYFENNTLHSGVIYDPLTDSLYSATVGKGAFKKNGDSVIKLEISKKPLEELILAGTFTPAIEVFEMSIKLQPYVREVRILGSAALDLCWAAEGKLGIVMRFGTKAWDIAAGHMIYKEAGGNVFDWEGKEMSYDLTKATKKYAHIATHPDLLSQIMELTKRS